MEQITKIPIATTFGCIRPWGEQDAGSLVKFGNNPKIAKNLRDGFPSPYTLEAANRFLANVAQQNPTTFFALEHQGEAVGAVGLSISQDVHRFSAELAYWLGEPLWGKGWMSEAVDLFCRFGFETFQLIRIFAEPYAINHASGRVLEKAGFTLEGRLKCSVVKDGKVLDQLMYARINPDYL